MSRAGLVALLLLALSNCIALAACIPLPSPIAVSDNAAVSFVQRRHLDVDVHAAPYHRVVTSLAAAVDGGSQSSFTVASKTPVQSQYVQVTGRDLDEDTFILVRRESIGDKIKHAFQHLGEKIKGAFQHVGNKIKEGFQKFGQKVKEGFHKVKDAFVHVGHKIKDAFVHVGHKIKEGFIKVGHAIKHAAQKVGAWMKDTGKKIVKVALKVASVIHKVVGKVVGWIPGIGKPLGKIFDLTSKGLNAASNAIHADLGGKLNGAMSRMDTGLKVMKYIP